MYIARALNATYAINIVFWLGGKVMPVSDWCLTMLLRYHRFIISHGRPIVARPLVQQHLGDSSLSQVRSFRSIQFFSPEKISFEKLERDGNGCTVEEREKVYIYTQRGARSENLPDRSDLDFTG